MKILLAFRTTNQLYGIFDIGSGQRDWDLGQSAQFLFGNKRFLRAAVCFVSVQVFGLARDMRPMGEGVRGALRSITRIPVIDGKEVNPTDPKRRQSSDLW